MKNSAADNPILNGPYDEPVFHYSTDAAGYLNYADIRQSGRIFGPNVSQIPFDSSPQGAIFDLNEPITEYRDEIVNKIRENVGRW